MVQFLAFRPQETVIVKGMVFIIRNVFWQRFLLCKEKAKQLRVTLFSGVGWLGFGIQLFHFADTCFVLYGLYQNGEIGEM